MKDKAQVTVEFISVMAILSVIFLVTLNFIVAERRSMAQSLFSIDAQDTAQKVASAINSVYIAGDGASLNVTLPARLVGGVNYTTSVRPRLVTVTAIPSGSDFERKFQTGDVRVSGGGTAVGPGTVLLENINGTVELTTY